MKWTSAELQAHSVVACSNKGEILLTGRALGGTADYKLCGKGVSQGKNIPRFTTSNEWLAGKGPRIKKFGRSETIKSEKKAC